MRNQPEAGGCRVEERNICWLQPCSERWWSAATIEILKRFIMGQLIGRSIEHVCVRVCRPPYVPGTEIEWNGNCTFAYGEWEGEWQLGSSAQKLVYLFAIYLRKPEIWFRSGQFMKPPCRIGINCNRFQVLVEKVK